MSAEVEQLVVRFARENRTWGHDRIVGALANLGITVSDRTVGAILSRHGVPPAPERRSETTWAEFIRSHQATLAATDFFSTEVWTLGGLVTFYVLFVVHLATRRLPARSPNLNAVAERFVRSVKSEGLDRTILFGGRSLRHVLREYMAHYHAERNHQGVGNRLLFPDPDVSPSRVCGRIDRRERLGGLLSFYRRVA